MAAALIVAAISDCLFRRIPNGVSLLILVAGCGFQFCESGLSGLWLGLQGFWVGFAVALPLYLFAGLGGGDLKLLAAGGVLLGPSLILQAVAWSAVLGGVVALIAVLVSPQRSLTLRRWLPWTRPALPDPAVSGADDPGKRRMPMAPALALGMLFVVLQSGAFTRIFAVRNMVDLMQCAAPYP